MDSGLLIFIVLLGLIILANIINIILHFKRLLNWRSVIITVTVITTIGSMVPPIVDKGPFVVILIFGIVGGGLGWLTMYIFAKMFSDIFKKQR